MKLISHGPLFTNMYNNDSYIKNNLLENVYKIYNKMEWSKYQHIDW